MTSKLSDLHSQIADMKTLITHHNKRTNKNLSTQLSINRLINEEVINVKNVIQNLDGLLKDRKFETEKIMTVAKDVLKNVESNIKKSVRPK